MIVLSVNMKGHEELVRYLGRVSNKTKREINRTTKKLANLLARRIKMRVSRMRSGRGALKRSIRVRKATASKGYEVSIGGRLKRPYHVYQEYGFKPHIVTARMLRRQGRSNTKFYRFLMSRKSKTSMVRWSGKSYVRSSIASLEPKINQEINRLGERIVRG